jgi:hypothetical protein
LCGFRIRHLRIADAVAEHDDWRRPAYRCA